MPLIWTQLDTGAPAPRIWSRLKGTKAGSCKLQAYLLEVPVLLACPPRFGLGMTWMCVDPHQTCAANHFHLRRVANPSSHLCMHRRSGRECSQGARPLSDGNPVEMCNTLTATARKDSKTLGYTFCKVEALKHLLCRTNATPCQKLAQYIAHTVAPAYLICRTRSQNPLVLLLAMAFQSLELWSESKRE